MSAGQKPSPRPTKDHITAAEHLQYLQEQKNEKESKRIAQRQQRLMAEEAQRLQDREEGERRRQERAAALAGTSQKSRQTFSVNESGGEWGASPYRTLDETKRWNREKLMYEKRQERLAQKSHSTNYNIITGAPL